MHTPPKTNMEPENGALKQEIPIGNPPFSGSMLNLRGSMCEYTHASSKDDHLQTKVENG